jgi:glycosyltransferase involved in cell wall biosynthesis
VVGWKTADLAEAVADGETGFLVAPGDRVQLAAKTRAALDPATAARLGAAGRERALDRYPVGRAAEQFARVYDELATGLGERGA